MGTCFASRQTRRSRICWLRRARGGILGSRDLTFAEISAVCGGRTVVSVTADSPFLLSVGRASSSVRFLRTVA